MTVRPFANRGGSARVRIIFCRILGKSMAAVFAIGAFIVAILLLNTIELAARIELTD